MALRFYDTEMWKDTWFKNLTPNQQRLFWYLLCQVQTDGVIEDWDEGDAEYSLRSDLESVASDLESLCSHFKGVQRVILRRNEETGNDMILLRNYIKVQLNGKKVLNHKNPAHLSTWEKVIKHSSIFPELKALYQVTKESLGSDTEVSKNKKEKEKKNINKRRGESEGGTDSLYEMMRSLPGMEVNFADWKTLQKYHPQVDWDRLVRHICMKHESGNPVPTPIGYMSFIVSKSRDWDKPGSDRFVDNGLCSGDDLLSKVRQGARDAEYDEVEAPEGYEKSEKWDKLVKLLRMYDGEIAQEAMNDFKKAYNNGQNPDAKCAFSYKPVALSKPVDPGAVKEMVQYRRKLAEGLFKKIEEGE